MSKTTFTLLCTGLLLIAAGCATVINTEIYHDQQLDFSEYQTFAFLDQSGKPARLNDPFMNTPQVRDTIRQLIEAKMIERGFERVRINDADFLIAIHGGTGDYLREEMKRWRYGFSRHWNYTDDHIYPEGSLIIDFFDQEENTAFWRGSAGDILGGENEVSDDMRKAVSKLIDAYPPNKAPIESPSL